MALAAKQRIFRVFWRRSFAIVRMRAWRFRSLLLHVLSVYVPLRRRPPLRLRAGPPSPASSPSADSFGRARASPPRA
eukprot:988062-Pyramimonas_sp.AAC.1